MRIIFLLAICAAGYLIYKLYLEQLLAEGKSGKIKIALIALGLFFLAMAVMGRANALFGVLGAGMTQIMRLIPLIIKYAPSLGKYLGVPLGPGGPISPESRLRTKSLLMTIDHQTGRLDGEILVGDLAGKRLSDLTNPELKRFYDDCQENDLETVRILQAYISRERSSWESAPGGSDSANRPATSDTVTVREAYDILGLAQGASQKEITEAHRALMKQFHPDKGGSNYLAAKINEAKKVLLSHIFE